jgi:hypothetical protein
LCNKRSEQQRILSGLGPNGLLFANGKLWQNAGATRKCQAKGRSDEAEIPAGNTNRKSLIRGGTDPRTEASSVASNKEERVQLNFIGKPGNKLEAFP